MSDNLEVELEKILEYTCWLLKIVSSTLESNLEKLAFTWPSLASLQDCLLPPLDALPMLMLEQLFMLWPKFLNVKSSRSSIMMLLHYCLTYFASSSRNAWNFVECEEILFQGWDHPVSNFKWGPHSLFEKSNFCPKIQFWQNFTSFYPIFFFDNFSREIKVVNS